MIRDDEFHKLLNEHHEPAFICPCGGAVNTLGDYMDHGRRCRDLWMQEWIAARRDAQVRIEEVLHSSTSWTLEELSSQGLDLSTIVQSTVS